MQKSITNLLYNCALGVRGILAYCTNIMYFILSKIKYPVLKSTAHPFKKKRVLISDELVKRPEWRKLASNLISLFQSEKEFVFVGPDGRYKRGVPGKIATCYLNEKAVPHKEIIELIEKTEAFKVLCQNFGCEFYCRTVAIFKTSVFDGVSTGSFAFHRDGHPFGSFKLLIYVTDVLNETSGPTSLLPGTHKTLVPGLPDLGSKRQLLDDKYHKNMMIGPSGTMALFDTSVLHAGGRTVNGERIVATLQFFPKYSSKLRDRAEAYRFGALEYDVLPKF